MPSHLATALVITVVLVASGAEAAQAASFVGGTDNWSVVGAPQVVALGISPAAATTFQNNLDVSVLGIVIMVMHNNLGQMVYYSTATLNLTRGFSGTAYTIEFGVPVGIYNATVFAFSTGGVAISNSSTFAFPAR